MTNKSTLRKIAFVALSNIIKMSSSIIIAFMIPDILGVVNYGYYKVFLLYLTYVGLFHFGFIDGIYLKYGGVDFEHLPKNKFKTYFKFLLNLELVISLIGIIISILFIPGDKKLIFVLLFINMIAINLTTYFQFISQITSRFNEFSIRLIALSIGNLVLAIIMYILDINDYKIYIILIIIFNYLMLFWYLFTYRSITFGNMESIKNNYQDIGIFFKTGIPLLLANLASTIVMTVDKQIVEIFFTIEEFSVYSFAYSMLTIVTVVVSAVGIVLYPTLKKTSSENIASNYDILNRIVIVVVLLGLIGYFPLLWLIPNFLPDYTNSLIVFRIALPGLVISSTITAVKHNFYKITGKNMLFFYVSMIAIIVSVALNISAYYAFKDTLAVAISSIIGLSLWYVMTEYYMIKMNKVKWGFNSLIAMIGIISFYLLTSIENVFISSLSYALVVGIVIVFSYKSILQRIVQLNSKN